MMHLGQVNQKSGLCGGLKAVPSILANDIQDLKVQSPQAERPLPVVAISRFEVSTAGLRVRPDIPAATSLICNQWQSTGPRDLLDKM